MPSTVDDAKKLRMAPSFLRTSDTGLSTATEPDAELAAVDALATMHRVEREAALTSGPLKFRESTPAHDSFDRMQAIADIGDVIVVQTSARKWQLGRRSHIAASNTVVVPYVTLEPTKYTMFNAYAEYERRQAARFKRLLDKSTESR